MAEALSAQLETLEVYQAIVKSVLVAPGQVRNPLLTRNLTQDRLPPKQLLPRYANLHIFTVEKEEEGSKTFACDVLVGGLDEAAVIHNNYKKAQVKDYFRQSNRPFIIVIMIRSRYAQLVQQRRQRRQSKPNPQGQEPQVVPYRPPTWEYDYYHYKSQLADVASTNRDIQQLIEQYNINPTVYNIRALERMLEANCKRINQIQHWAAHFPFATEPPSEVQLERNLVRHFQSSVLTHINTIFLFRGRLTQLIDERNARDNSFNSLNSSNISWNSVNKPVHERGESIREVSSQIEALNSILRKMGDIAAMQGDLINRIDENLNEGVDHVSRGRSALGERAEREEGCSGQFSCEGRINKVIMALYLTNVVLIFILVLKNL